MRDRTIAFLGLGVMGYPLAGHLAKNNFNLSVFNRTAKKSEAWCLEFSGRAAATPAEAATDADVVIACVTSDAALRDVTLGIGGAEGAFHSMRPGSLFIDHSTISASTTKALHKEAAKHQIGFLDAPVSGGEEGAHRGALSIMVGGNTRDYERAEPILKIYANRINYLGPSGSGQLTKMVNQIMVAGITQAVSEGLRLLEETNVDSEAALASILEGAAYSRLLEYRGATMLERRFDFGFAADLMLKDIDISLSEAKSKGLQLPLTCMVREFLQELHRSGSGQLDVSGLIARL